MMPCYKATASSVNMPRGHVVGQLRRDSLDGRHARPEPPASISDPFAGQIQVPVLRFGTQEAHPRSYR